MYRIQWHRESAGNGSAILERGDCKATVLQAEYGELQIQEANIGVPNVHSAVMETVPLQF